MEAGARLTGHLVADWASGPRGRHRRWRVQQWPLQFGGRRV